MRVLTVEDMSVPYSESAMNKGKILRFRMERAAPNLGVALKVLLLTFAQDRKFQIGVLNIFKFIKYLT